MTTPARPCQPAQGRERDQGPCCGRGRRVTARRRVAPAGSDGAPGIRRVPTRRQSSPCAPAGDPAWPGDVAGPPLPWLCPGKDQVDRPRAAHHL